MSLQWHRDQKAAENAFALGQIDEPEFVERMTGLGMTARDAKRHADEIAEYVTSILTVA
jgi:hypothetical protein